MIKTVLICWSGGLDSTYLIQYYLEKNYNVEVINCQLKNAPKQQVKREQIAIKKMLNGYFKDKNVKFIGNIVTEVHGDNAFSKSSLPQVSTWLYGLFCSLNYHHEEVAVGYIMNDDAISFLDDIKNAWKGYKGLVHGDLPKLVFPLVKYKKNTIFHNLNSELRKHVT